MFDAVFRDLGHRGPDASGVAYGSEHALGMNRLRFRGDPVALPVSGDGLVSAFNGQVYGYLGPGGAYTPIVDGVAGEIAIAATCTAADGMFAYSRYSPRTASFTLATDWHFIKPLFVRQFDSGTVFASEMTPLLKHGQRAQVDLEALAELFAYGWYLSDQTCAAQVSLVWKHDVQISANGLERMPKRAASAQSLAPTLTAAGAPALRRAIAESVRRSTLGCGPIGLALSGGLDSSILAWELNALGFEELVCITVQTADGAEDLGSLAQLGLPVPGAWQRWKHVIVAVDDQHFLDAFAASTRAFGQPTTMSSLPLYQQLADAAAVHGVRAMLLGEGVDEYFAGYASYAKAAALPTLQDYYRFPARRRLVECLFGQAARARVESRFDQQYGECSDLREIETQMRLTRLLLRSDVCLMSRSIEGRVPFLHNGIPAMAMALSWDEVSAEPGKMPLRRAYLEDLGERAMRPKVRFKSSDAMLLRCLDLDNLEGRVVDQCAQLFGRAATSDAIASLRSADGFDADVLCLLMSLTFLLESGLLDGDSGH
jgi:asparagine synthase (glutamine-hydrolysing)